jgi:branched-chain amino acid transport system substrate-binding protein
MKDFVARLIVALAAAFGPGSLAHAEILIGMPGPLTGGIAWFGEQMQEGIGMKVAELNAAGGFSASRSRSFQSTITATPSRRLLPPASSWRRRWTPS